MKLTKKHFELFKKECLYWIDRFQLNNYDVVYEFKKMENEDALMTGSKNFTATIALNENLDEKFDYNMKFPEMYIKQLAKHEITHLLLRRLSLMRENDNGFYEAEEEIVYKLDKIIK